MADNIAVKDGNGVLQTLRMIDIGGGILVPFHVAAAYKATGTLHRDAITAIDKLGTTPNPTLTAVNTTHGGLATLTWNAAVCAGTRYGNALPSNNVAIALANPPNNSVQIDIGQVAGAEWYDVFFSNNNPPYWMCRITEAQRAAGNIYCAARGTVSVGDGSPAGSIYLDVSTIIVPAITTAPYTVDNSYNLGAIVAASCTGYQNVRLSVKVNPTDLRSVPSCTLIPFFYSTVAADYFSGDSNALNLLGAAGQPLQRQFVIDVGGDSLIVLIDAIGGQGTAVSIWVEPY